MGPASVCSHGMRILKDRIQLFYRYSLLHFFIIRLRFPILDQNTSKEFMCLEVQRVLLSLTDNVNFSCKVKTLCCAKQYGKDQDYVYKL